jgi:hypothetical protein
MAEQYKRNVEWEAENGGRKAKNDLPSHFPYCYHFDINSCNNNGKINI